MSQPSLMKNKAVRAGLWPRSLTGLGLENKCSPVMALQCFHSSPYECHWFRHQEIFRVVLSAAAKCTALLPLLPACCTIIPLSVTPSMSLPCQGDEMHGKVTPLLSFQTQEQQGQIQSLTAGTGMGQCQKPFRLSNIPLSSLHCLNRQRVSRHLLPQPVSSLGKGKKSHVPRHYIKYKWHEGFCHLADLLRGKRLSKDNEWLKWQGKKKSMISQRKK